VNVRRSPGSQARSAKPTAAALAVIALVAPALPTVGCGSGGEETSAWQRAAERQAELTGGGRTSRSSPANRPPKDSTPFIKELYRQFPPPEPQPEVRGSAAAIKVGEKTCAGKTPVEVKEAFFPIAVEKGDLDPNSSQGKMIARIDEFERHITEEVSFISGQLAAGAYQATLPPRLASSGFQGCIYAMAKELERRVSGRK
jgi:hypothetical protein